MTSRIETMTIPVAPWRVGRDQNLETELAQKLLSDLQGAAGLDGEVFPWDLRVVTLCCMSVIYIYTYV